MDERPSPGGHREVALDGGPVDDVAARYQMDVKGLLEDLARLQQATPWLEPAEVVPLSAHPGWRRRLRDVVGAAGPDAVVVDLDAWRQARGR